MEVGPQGPALRPDKTQALMCLKFRAVIREPKSHEVLRGHNVSEQTESTKGMLGKENCSD